MSWYIGTVALPRGPARALVKQGMDAKGYRMMSQKPMILSFGPKTRVLSLEGIIADHTKSISEIETSYLKPLKDMASKGLGFSWVVADDDMDSFWTLVKATEATNNIDVSMADDTSTVAKGADSLKITAVSGAVCARWYLEHNYSPAKDWSLQDFVTLWCYGSNTGSELQLWCGHDFAHRFKSPVIYDTYTGWIRYFWLKDDFILEGSPSWNNITKVGFENWSWNEIGTWYLDRIVIGLGQLIQTPHSLYDGIYFVQMFAYNEVERETNRFTYKLELWCQDDNF